MPDRRALSIGFLDSLFILLLALLVLTIPKVPEGKPAPEQPAVFLLETTWNDTSCSDIDTWLRTPRGKKVWYANKQSGIHSLDRDDLGCRSDSVTRPDGTTKTLHVNHEAITFRGWETGRYTVNLFVFYWNDDAPISATVRLVRLTPYQVVYENQVELSQKGQEVTLFSWDIDADGQVSGISQDPVKLTSAQ